MKLWYCHCQATHLTNGVVNGWAAKLPAMVHESFGAGKCQPAFIVIGTQHNIPTVNTAQVFLCLKYQHPKIQLGSRSQAVILKREYYIHIPEGKVIISGRNKNRNKKKIWSSTGWSCQPWDSRPAWSWVAFKNIRHLNLLGRFHQPQQTF